MLCLSHRACKRGGRLAAFRLQALLLLLLPLQQAALLLQQPAKLNQGGVGESEAERSAKFMRCSWTGRRVTAPVQFPLLGIQRGRCGRLALATLPSHLPQP